MYGKKNQLLFDNCQYLQSTWKPDACSHVKFWLLWFTFAATDPEQMKWAMTVFPASGSPKKNKLEQEQEQEQIWKESWFNCGQNVENRVLLGRFI